MLIRYAFSISIGMSILIIVYASIVSIFIKDKNIDAMAKSQSGRYPASECPRKTDHA